MKLEEKTYTIPEFLNLTKTSKNNSEVDLEKLLGKKDMNRIPIRVGYLKGASYCGEIIDMFVLVFTRDNSYRSVRIPDTNLVRQYLLSLDEKEKSLKIDPPVILSSQQPSSS